MLFGKTIVITGVSSGIGARAAQLALQFGADVIGLDVNEPRDHAASFIAADLSSLHAVQAVLERLPRQIDALCNVAGVAGTQGAAKTLGINFYGARTLSEVVAPRLREGGAIVNVASIAGYGWRTHLHRARGLVGIPGFPDTAEVVREFGIKDEEGYPVSKEALLLWTLRAAHQNPFRARGIRVNAVSPGPVETPILEQFRTAFGDTRVDSDVARLGGAGNPSDVAPAILFLCSDGARWINGVNLPVDGGLEASINAEVLGF